MERPKGSNADEWLLFLKETTPEYACVQIAEALDSYREIGLALLNEFTLERDQLYDSVTNGSGECDDEDDRRAVAEMDEIIQQARTVLLPDQRV